MDKLLEFFYSTVEKEDYSKAMKIGMFLLILFAPSISIIFLYKRDLFMTMDITKLLLIGVVINIIFFVLIYTSLKMFTNLELVYDTYEYSSLGKEIIQLKENLDKGIDNDIEKMNELREKATKNYERFSLIPRPVKNHNIKMIRLSKEYISMFTILIWVLYLWDYMINKNITSEFAIKRLVFYVTFIWLTHIVKMLFGIKKYVSKIKEPYRICNDKEYSILKDKSIWINIGLALVGAYIAIVIIINCFKQMNNIIFS